MSPRIQRNNNEGSKLYVGNNPVSSVYLGSTLVYENTPQNSTPGSDAATTLMSSVTKNGVTFNFDQQYPVGQYANGDYFVVAPAGGSLVSTSPAFEITSATRSESGIALPDREINGMGVNMQRRSNPFDSYYKGTNNETNTSYWAAKNFDPAKIGSAYTFSPGESLVKAVSLTTPPDNSRPAIEKLVVLTVVDTVPKEGAFRPPPWGDNKSIPDSWRVDNIDWSKVPEVDVGQPTPNWSVLADQALVTWQTGNLWGNGVRNLTPAEQPNYRRDIGEKLGDFIQALASPGSQADKMDLMIGTLQIGIDQVVAGEITNDTAGTEPSERYDIGRRGVTVLASLLLPETQRLDNMLANDWIWQDLSSYGIIEQYMIDHWDDDTQRGAVEGMQGIPEYTGARPNKFSVRANRPDLTFGATALSGTPSATYRRIGLQTQWVGTNAIHLFDGGQGLFNSPAQVQYNDRWLTLVEAGWPGVGEVNPFGVPTGYMSGSAVVPPSDIDFFKATRDLMSVPRVETLGLMPERPEPPELIENGTQIIVKPLSPYVGYGAAQAQMDIRYIKTEQDGTVSYDGVEYPAYKSVGSWTEINDAQPNPNGDFLISPTTLGGLDDNSRYCVAIRYRSTRGIGPWSNNWTFGYKPGSTNNRNDPWIAGAVTTTTERTATAPSFVTPPEINSYFTESRPIRVRNININGFPAPAVSYQWSLDGTPVPGATAAVFATSAGDAGRTPSVEVTLTNTEGTTSTTIAGQTIAAGAGDTGYRPTRYEAEGNASIYVPANNSIDLMPTSEVSKVTFALWVGQADFAFQARGRSAIFIGDGSVSMGLTDSGGTTVASYEFGDYRPEMAWYLISIDASEPNNDEKIKVWRKLEGSPYPAEHLPIVRKNTEFAASEFVLARNISFGSYWQRIYSEKDPEEFSTLSDYWAKDGVALSPSDFWNESGHPYNIDNIGNPRVRMGGSQTEAQFAARENSGSVGSPLPAENTGTSILKSGVIDIGN